MVVSKVETMIEGGNWRRSGGTWCGFYKFSKNYTFVILYLYPTYYVKPLNAKTQRSSSLTQLQQNTLHILAGIFTASVNL